MDKLLSVIIPAFNEERLIGRAALAVSEVLGRAGIKYELIFVDDGSRDATWEMIERTCAEDARVRGVGFSRNFGKDRAIFAGLSRARGDAAVVMDCDLQHPPELICDMYKLWQEGWEVVRGKKRERTGESFFHRLAAAFFDRLISRAVGADMGCSSDFILMDRKAVDALLSFGEEEVFFRGLAAFVGFRSTTLEFTVADRVDGVSKWSLKSLVRYALLNITSFSTTPLTVSGAAGFLTLLTAFVLALGLIISGGARGWFIAAAVAIAAAVGVLLVCLCVLGYYVGRLYRNAQGRPRYVISRECGGGSEQ